MALRRIALISFSLFVLRYVCVVVICCPVAYRLDLKYRENDQETGPRIYAWCRLLVTSHKFKKLTAHALLQSIRWLIWLASVLHFGMKASALFWKSSAGLFTSDSCFLKSGHLLFVFWHHGQVPRPAEAVPLSIAKKLFPADPWHWPSGQWLVTKAPLGILQQTAFADTLHAHKCIKTFFPLGSGLFFIF